ncbi:cysteine-rich CWC family protein [Pseudomonas schmalbachii]|uniref:Cysteine-rich CWC family protein n=1 Tax=Pseudomonas schmalbachii TaxID=2816993 RepID=A0ABS3TUG5_9PSED|nr:cysteine-rich CWC family protein [Pseudomonas schmalbachii]MBO3277297.1 cysteine-rich CWC family protein [Pseudomonas schmalbachii]
MSDTLDPTRCPLCGQSNRCTQADPERQGESCWCFEARVDPAALERISPEQRNRTCLCPRCAANLPPEND